MWISGSTNRRTPMNAWMTNSTVAAVALIVAGTAHAQPAKETAPVTVGRVIIVGNKITRDDVIRKAVALFPGQQLRLPELEKSERKLARLGIFEVDPKKGTRPTVTAVDTDDPTIKDVLVQVQETHTGTCTFAAGCSIDGRLRISCVLDERNLDPARVPTGPKDWIDGRAFRGAGQKFHFEVFNIGVAPGRPLELTLLNRKFGLRPTE
jgi:outer membrane protein assembly factor BamA